MSAPVIFLDVDKNTYLSSRNLKNCHVTNVRDLNTYDILNAHHLLFVESSIKELEKTE